MLKELEYDIREEFLYLTALSLFLLYFSFRMTEYGRIQAISSVTGIGVQLSYVFLLVLFFYKGHYTWKDTLGVVLLFIMGIASDCSVYNKQLIFAMLFIYFSSNVRYEKILKVYFFIQAGIWGITVGGSLIGIIPNNIQSEYTPDLYYLGYTAATYSAHVLVFLVITWFVLRKKANIVDYVVAIAINIFIHNKVEGQADYLDVYIALAGFLLIQLYQKYPKLPLRTAFRKMSMFFLPGLLTMYSILYILKYRNPDGFKNLNEFLSGRIRREYDAIRNYGFSIFPREMRWVGTEGVLAHPNWTYNYVDQSFLHESITYGVIVIVLIIIALIVLQYKLIRQQEIKLAWALNMLVLYSVINAHLLFLQFNPFILLVGILFSWPLNDRKVTGFKFVE